MGPLNVVTCSTGTSMVTASKVKSRMMLIKSRFISEGTKLKFRF